MHATIISIMGYALLLFGASLWHHRKGRKGNEDFLIADRHLSYKMAGFSIFASFVGGGTIIGNTNLVFTYGLPMLSFVFALPCGLLILNRFSVKIKEKSKEEGWLTYYDMFHSRFGLSVKILVACLQILGLLLIGSVALITGAKMIQLLADISYVYSVFLMALVVMTYLMISGFSSVVKTDFIQCIFLLVLFAGFAVFALVAPVDATSFKELNFEPINPIAPVMFFALALIYVFGDEGMFQRIYATKDPQTVKKSINFVFVMYVIFYLSLMVAVFKLKAFFPELSGDMAFLEGLTRIIPENFHWLVSLAVLSVVLSSIDTYIFAAVMNINKLFLEKKGRPQVIHKKLVKNIKITLPVAFVLMILIALFVQNALDAAYFYSGLAGCNALIVIMALLIPRMTKWYAFVPIALNFVIMSIFIIWKGFSPIMAAIPFVSVILGTTLAFLINKLSCKLQTTEAEVLVKNK